MTSNLAAAEARCSRLSRWFALPFIVLVATACCDDSLFALSSGSDESSDATYHSTVSEVRLVFFATDENNRNVQELRKDDFAIVDDEKVIREFRGFTRANSVNLDVVILIDSSDSVQPHFQRVVTDVEQLILQSQWNSGDRISVLSFGGLESHLICAGSCRTSFHADQVVSRGGATPLLDALDAATTFLIERRQSDVWPVILLFSDGDDTISKTSFRHVREKILESGSQIYAIDVSNSKRVSNGTTTLQRLAGDSGGRYMGLNEGPVKILKDVMDDLHSGLLVTYTLPQSSSEFHSIRVLPTHNLNLQFRCRRGYYSRPAGSVRQEDGP
jgi:VWFA-related protein